MYGSLSRLGNRLVRGQRPEGGMEKGEGEEGGSGRSRLQAPSSWGSPGRALPARVLQTHHRGARPRSKRS